MNPIINIAVLVLALLPGVWSRPASPGPETPAMQERVIRDPAEYRAYMSARAIQNAEARAAAMEAFVRSYPNSVVRIDALEEAMAAYQQAGNHEKVAEVARRILMLQPDNIRSLAIVTFMDRNRAARNSNNSQAVQDTCSESRRGLQAMAGWRKPSQITDVEFDKLRTQVAIIFYGAAGFCALQSKDYSVARDYCLKAYQLDSTDMQNTYQLAIADLEMNPLDTLGFWYAAKAMHLAQAQQNDAARQNIYDYSKAKYRNYHGSEDGWDQLVAQAVSQSSPPARLNVKQGPKPEDLAADAAEKFDTQTLSFSDWEFILQYRDASPRNRAAANKVWQSIQDKEKNGQAKLKFPVKVISADRNFIYGAITEDNQSANKADVKIMLEKPLQQPPAAGDSIEVIGIISDYTPNPFMFSMTEGELPPPRLSELEIEELLKGGVTPKRVITLVKEGGVDFTLDSSNRTRLRQAGATQDLLDAIAASKR